MGSYWTKLESEECDECSDLVEELIQEQEMNVDRLGCEIKDLQSEYQRYTDEHEKMTTLALISQHRECQKRMFTHLSQLRQSRVRIRILRSQIMDKRAIDRETTLLKKIQKDIERAERNLLFNEEVAGSLAGIHPPVLDELSEFDMLQLKGTMLKLDSKKKEPEFIFVV